MQCQARAETLLRSKGFVQLGHDVESIIGSTYPGFTFGGPNSVRLISKLRLFIYKFRFSSSPTVE